MKIEKNIITMIHNKKPADFPFKSEAIFRISETPKSEEFILKPTKQNAAQAKPLIDVKV